MPIAIALCLSALSALAEPPKTPPGPNNGIAWEANYEQAKLKAAGEGKLLFVDILTDG